MTIISALKDYMLTFPGWESGASLQIDQLGNEPTQYAIMPITGARVVENYIDGGSLREYPFAIESMETILDDTQRIQNSAFYETLADWLESQTLTGNLPSLGTDKIATRIEALGHGALFEFGESGTGIYQIQCKLVYEQMRR